MNSIILIHDRSELKGTCYFELLPGEYRDTCWNEGSVFLSEETFLLIEPVVARHERRFDHYSFVGIRRHVWNAIIVDLDSLAKRCESAKCLGDLGLSFSLFESTESEFNRDFSSSSAALAKLSRELTGWLRTTLRTHECVTILGM